jgi:hypothetical protein
VREAATLGHRYVQYTRFSTRQATCLCILSVASRTLPFSPLSFHIPFSRTFTLLTTPDISKHDLTFFSSSHLEVPPDDDCYAFTRIHPISNALPSPFKSHLSIGLNVISTKAQPLKSHRLEARYCTRIILLQPAIHQWLQVCGKLTQYISRH